MSNGPRSPQSQAAPWARLRAWIDEKEAWEREHNAPAPLTPQELAAIANLVSFIPEPDIGDRDHVSALLREFRPGGLKPTHVRRNADF